MKNGFIIALLVLPVFLFSGICLAAEEKVAPAVSEKVVVHYTFYMEEALQRKYAEGDQKAKDYFDPLTEIVTTNFGEHFASKNLMVETKTKQLPQKKILRLKHVVHSNFLTAADAKQMALTSNAKYVIEVVVPSPIIQSMGYIIATKANGCAWIHVYVYDKNGSLVQKIDTEQKSGTSTAVLAQRTAIKGPIQEAMQKAVEDIIARIEL